MKTPIQLATIAGIGVLFVCPLADASYQGIGLRLHTTAQVNGINRDVWRIYAVFSDPGDYLTTVSGSPTLGNMVIQTLNVFGNHPGGNFVNPVGGSATSPTFKAIGTQLEWDTYVTIGGGLPDQTGLSPGFSGIGNVASINTNNAGWFTAGPLPQGLAGNGLANFWSPGTWGVLIMQLTVNAGNGARGTVAIGGVNNNPLAGQSVFQTNADQTFTTHPPAPATIGLLAVAGLVGRTRRRH